MKGEKAAGVTSLNNCHNEGEVDEWFEGGENKGPAERNDIQLHQKGDAKGIGQIIFCHMCTMGGKPPLSSR